MVIYACTLGRIATSDSDGMDSCTRVPAAMHAWGLWPCPVMSDKNAAASQDPDAW
jgi:hypothetical protein